MNMNHQTECELCSEMLFDYMSGDINEENRLLIKQHLDSCENCQRLFENIENDAMLENQKINFRKLRIKLVAKLIGIVLITLLFLTLIRGFFIPLSLNLIFGYKIPIAERVFIDSFQYTLPSARITSNSTSLGIMSLNIGCKYSQDFLNASSNQINLTIPNFIGKATTSQGINSNSIFIENPSTNSGNNMAVWSKLDKISDIAVCQVVIYFTKPLSADELDTFLSQIHANNRFSWAILDTGNTDLNDNWGFPIEVQPVFRENGFVSIPSANHASKDFQTELQFLAEHHTYLGSKATENDVAFLNQYIHDNGISIRGVVVVAPANNLIKLKDSDLIAKMSIAKAELDYKTEY